jgi:tRNA A37 methylthiotransferase MiaB
MRVLLLQPPIRDYYHTEVRLQPLGLAYLKAAVRKHLPEAEVILRDYHHGWGRHTVTPPQELSYLRDYYSFHDQSPFCVFHQYYHFGADFRELAQDVAAARPDLVGISSMFSAYHREVVETARSIRQECGAPILAGGTHASAHPESLLQSGCVDFLIRGEGERPLVELLKAIRDGTSLHQVPNLLHKSQRRFTANPMGQNYAFADLPPPDFSDFPIDRYRYDGRPSSMVMNSRGCPFRCAFCSVHSTFDRFQRRAAAETVAEIVRRYREGIRVFDFEDDNLTLFPEETKELCRLLIDALPDGDAQMLAMNGVAYEGMDSDLLRLMRKAGFTHLNLSLVTANGRLRRTMARMPTVRDFLRVVQQASTLGFKIVSYQILGMPGDTVESMSGTLTLLAGLPVLVGASPFYLTPGAPLASCFAPLDSCGLVRARLTAMAIETEDFDRDDIFTLFVSSRIINFLKSIDFVGSEAPLQEVLEAARREGGRAAIGALLLGKLLEERRLYGWCRNQFRPVPRFKAAVFFDVWSRLDRITTQKGKNISLPEGVEKVEPG